MKGSKNFRLILMILISVLIILVGFAGIYSKKGNAYKNILPEYELASDLEGLTVLEFEIDNGKEEVYYDKDGKEVDASTVTDKNKKDYTKKEFPINEEANLTLDNYKKTVEIMKERLAFLQVNQYRMDLDEKTGKIVLAFEYAYPDDIKSIIPMEGKLELVDSNTEDVILSYTDFNLAEATYAALDNGKYNIYINLKLNDSGIEKINNIDKYKATAESGRGETEENKEKESEEATVNKFKVMFDKDEIAEISYDDILVIGKTLRITTAANLDTDSSINSQLNTNTIVSKLATMGKLPVIYNIEAEEYVQSSAKEGIEYIIMGLGAICLVISIYFIIKFKAKGLLVVISFIANIAIFLLIIRYTHIEISLNAFAGIIGLILLNAILINNILKCIKEKDKTFSENIKNAYLKTLDVFVVMLIIFAVFAFSKMTVISSMGLLVFWGWLVTIIGNLILTVPMLSIVNKK